MKLPVWRTSVEVIDYCWRERRLLVRFAAPPFILTIVLPALVMAFTPNESPYAVGGLALVQMFIFAPMTITWYRIVVLGEDEARNRPLFALGRREWRLIGWQVAALFAFGCAAAICYGITASLGTDAAIIAVINAIWTVAWVVGIIYALMRLTIVMALVAVDQPIDFIAIWRMTQGITGGLFACTALLALASTVVGLVFKLFGFILGGLGAITANSPLEKILVYVQMIGNTLVNALSVILTATMFGFVYKMLTAYALSVGMPPESVAPTSESGRPARMARLINASIWLYLWLSGVFVPLLVPEGGSYWEEKAKQLIAFGPFDDIPRLLGRGVWFMVPWLVIHLLLGRKKKAPAVSPEPG